jgi:hypothetical protein
MIGFEASIARRGLGKQDLENAVGNARWAWFFRFLGFSGTAPKRGHWLGRTGVSG